MEPAAAEAAASSVNLVDKVNWSSPSWDLFIGLFFLIAVVMYAFLLGRERNVVAMLSIYTAFAIATAFPFINAKLSNKFQIGPPFAMRIVIFTLFLVLIYILLNRAGTLSNLSASFGVKSLITMAVLSFLQVGLFISIMLSFLPPEVRTSFASWIQLVFLSKIGLTIWLIGPVIALVLVKREEDPAPLR